MPSIRCAPGAVTLFAEPPPDCGAELHLGLLFTRQIEIYGTFMGSKGDMGQIVEMLNRGVIRPAIHQVFPLAQAAAAHETMEETNFFGKLLLRP